MATRPLLFFPTIQSGPSSPSGGPLRRGAATKGAADNSAAASPDGTVAVGATSAPAAHGFPPSSSSSQRQGIKGSVASAAAAAAPPAPSGAGYNSSNSNNTRNNTRTAKHKGLGTEAEGDAAASSSLRATASPTGPPSHSYSHSRALAVAPHAPLSVRPYGRSLQVTAMAPTISDSAVYAPLQLRLWAERFGEEAAGLGSRANACELLARRIAEATAALAREAEVAAAAAAMKRRGRGARRSASRDGEPQSPMGRSGNNLHLVTPPPTTAQTVIAPQVLTSAAAGLLAIHFAPLLDSAATAGSPHHGSNAIHSPPSVLFSEAVRLLWQSIYVDPSALGALMHTECLRPSAHSSSEGAAAGSALGGSDCSRSGPPFLGRSASYSVATTAAAVPLAISFSASGPHSHSVAFPLSPAAASTSGQRALSGRLPSSSSFRQPPSVAGGDVSLLRLPRLHTAGSTFRGGTLSPSSPFAPAPPPSKPSMNASAASAFGVKGVIPRRDDVLQPAPSPPPTSLSALSAPLPSPRSGSKAGFPASGPHRTTTATGGDRRARGGFANSTNGGGSLHNHQRPRESSRAAPFGFAADVDASGVDTHHRHAAAVMTAERPISSLHSPSAPPHSQLTAQSVDWAAHVGPLLTPTHFSAVAAYAPRYLVERQRAAHYAVARDSERRVVDRAVGHWKRSHLRAVFAAWRAHVGERAALRSRNRRLFGRASDKATVAAALSNWRLRARDVHLKAVFKSSVLLTDRLKLASQANAEAGTALEQQRTTRQRREMRLEALAAEKDALAVDIARAERRIVRVRALLHALRRQWALTIDAVFGDRHSAPASVFDWQGGHVAVTVVEGSADVRRKIRKNNRNKFTADVMLLLARVLIPAATDPMLLLLPSSDADSDTDDIPREDDGEGHQSDSTRGDGRAVAAQSTGGGVASPAVPSFDGLPLSSGRGVSSLSRGTATPAVGSAAVSPQPSGRRGPPKSDGSASPRQRASTAGPSPAAAPLSSTSAPPSPAATATPPPNISNLLVDEKALSAGEKAALACELYRRAAGGISTAPSSAMDMLRGDQMRQQLQAAVMLSLLSGGHCSAFRHRMPHPSAAPMPIASALAPPPPSPSPSGPSSAATSQQKQRQNQRGSVASAGGCVGSSGDASSLPATAVAATAIIASRAAAVTDANAAIIPPFDMSAEEGAHAMMADWRRGMALAEPSLVQARGVNTAAAAAVSVGNTIQSQRDSEALFDRFARLAATGSGSVAAEGAGVELPSKEETLPMAEGAERPPSTLLQSPPSPSSSLAVALPREFVEAAMRKAVGPDDWPLVALLYPSAGIRSFSDWAQYVAEAAEVSESAVSDIIAKMAANAFDDLTPLAELQLLMAADGCRVLLRRYIGPIEALYVAHSVAKASPKPPPPQEGEGRAAALLLRRRRSTLMGDGAQPSSSSSNPSVADPKLLSSPGGDGASATTSSAMQFSAATVAGRDMPLYFFREALRSLEASYAQGVAARSSAAAARAARRHGGGGGSSESGGSMWSDAEASFNAATLPPLPHTFAPNEEATLYGQCAAVDPTHRLSVRAFTVFLSVLCCYYWPCPYTPLEAKLGRLLSAAFGEEGATGLRPI